MELSNPKIKKIHIFLEMQLSTLIFFLYFRKNFPSWKNKKNPL